MTHSSKVSIIVISLLFANLILIPFIQADLLDYGNSCRGGVGTASAGPDSDADDTIFDYQDYDKQNGPGQDHDHDDLGFSPTEVVDSCNYINGLCIDGKCQCSNPGQMVYNEKTGECGIPTGGACNQSMDGCFTGNECRDNVCQCQNPREPLTTSNGTHGTTKCTSLRQEECETDNECSSKHYLGCFEGFCDCKSPMRAVYEEFGLRRGCRVRAGESCTPTLQNLSTNSSMTPVPVPVQQCVSNSMCTNRTQIGSITGHPSSSFVCQCKPGYFATPEGICKKEFSQPCTPTHQECNSYKGLTCKNGECVCVDEDTCYDKEQSACVSSIGQPCGLFSLWYDEYDIGCGKNAECILEDHRAHGHAHPREHRHGELVSVTGNESSSTSPSTAHTSTAVIIRKVCKCKPGFAEDMSSEGKQCVTKLQTTTSPTTTSTSTTTESPSYNEFDYSSG